MDIYNSVVKKPWGSEYCIYRGENVSIWNLTIEPGKKTSLHCHPNKKTGLILLAGDAQINLIERTFNISGPAKINLQQTIFHQTCNIGDKPLRVIEVETPDNKLDLVRIADDYGRKGDEFEGESEWDPCSSDLFRIGAMLTINEFASFKFTRTKLRADGAVEYLKYHPNCYIILLSDYAFVDKHKNQLCRLGDVLTSDVFETLNKNFELIDNIDVILIWKEQAKSTL